MTRSRCLLQVQRCLAARRTAMVAIKCMCVVAVLFCALLLLCVVLYLEHRETESADVTADEVITGHSEGGHV